jgi:biotin carboxylase
VPRVLLLLPTTSYRTPDFLVAAAKLDLDVTVASEEPSTMERLNPAGLLTLDFANLPACTESVAAFSAKRPVAAVVGVDERTVVAAAAVAARLGLAHNTVASVVAAGNKATMRQRLAGAAVASPRHRLFRRDDDSQAAAGEVAYPCVLKPTFLSASRGVIRADDAPGFVAAWRRLAAILKEPTVAGRGGDAAKEILVEDFVSGVEVALEGLLCRGELRVLALFDKPDPLDGPFFEETIYVTPSRHSRRIQEECARTAKAAARALGLTEGPVHAEMRINAGRVSVIEIAARSIGGLCSRALRFGTGMSLEELILRHALGLEFPAEERETRAAGVMMIPIPKAGILQEVRGLAEAREVSGIDEVTISAHVGSRLVPLPEGDRYLGFIFSRAETPELAEGALREAHARLEFRI